MSTVPYNVFEDALDKASITVLIISKRNTGKSYLMREMLRKLAPKYFSNIVAFSKTSHLNDDHAYTQNVIQNFNEETTKKILDYQQTRVLKNKVSTKPTNCHIAVILDDTIGLQEDKQTNQSDSLDELYACGRHSKITVFQASQYSKKISPTCRSNVDFLIIGTTSEGSLRSLWECTVGMEWRDFKEYVHKNTINHQFILYNNLTQNPEERFTIIKADSNQKNFRLVSKYYKKSNRSKKIEL